MDINFVQFDHLPEDEYYEALVRAQVVRGRTHWFQRCTEQTSLPQEDSCSAKPSEVPGS